MKDEIIKELKEINKKWLIKEFFPNPWDTIVKKLEDWSCENCRYKYAKDNNEDCFDCAYHNQGFEYCDNFKNKED